MPVSISPEASYHLCLDFSIAPPDHGQLKLGTVLKNLKLDGLIAPVNDHSHIPVPDSELRPSNGPDIKRGLHFSMNDLKKSEFSIWAKVFGAEGLGGMLGWLSKWSADEDLAIDALKTRYFNPSDEYMAKVLGSVEVKARLDVTKKKLPLYMITGIKWVEGVALSKKRSRENNVTGEGGVTDPHTGTSGGGKALYSSEGQTSASFEDSTDFVLGYRVREISWNWRGVMRLNDTVGGAVLDDGSKSAIPEVLQGIEYSDDFIGEENVEEAISTGKVVVVDGEGGTLGASVWVLP